MTRHVTPRLAGLGAALLLAACSGPQSLAGPGAERLAPCPSAPHCVGSEERDPRHAVAGFTLVAPAAESWPRVVQAVREMERATVVQSDARYLHAEIVSPWHFYTDDLELLLEPAAGRVQVRSSSRVGYYDFGVNRDRVEALRRTLAGRGLLR